MNEKANWMKWRFEHLHKVSFIDEFLKHEDVVADENVAEYYERCVECFKQLCKESYNKSMEKEEEGKING
jgi:hypothetical protein